MRHAKKQVVQVRVIAMDKNRQKVLEKIIEECFWEYRFTPKDLMEIALGDDEWKQRFLFGKIFENSTDILKALRVFPDKTLFRFVREQKVPSFKREFLERRLKILKFHFLKEKVSIPELEWRISG